MALHDPHCLKMREKMGPLLPQPELDNPEEEPDGPGWSHAHNLNPPLWSGDEILWLLQLGLSPAPVPSIT